MSFTTFRNAWRRLAARPAYTALSVAILGLGLGAMLFLLSVVNGAILAPLPFVESERLVGFGQMREGNDGVGGLDGNDYLLLAAELDSFERIGVSTQTTVNLSRDQGARRYEGAMLSAEVLPLLGVQPVLGRGFSAEDDRPGSAPVVLIGHAVWRNDFGADPDVVGRPVDINGLPGTIVGVMPEGFAFPYRDEVWLPRRLTVGDGFGAHAIARLKPGVGVAQAAIELETLAQRLGHDLKAHRDGQQLVLKPWALRFVSESIRQTVWLMFATGLLVALLACANVANLQLSQTLVRRRELAVRSALGAGQGRMLRELLAESLLLSLMATLIALALAEAGGRWLLETFIAAEGAPPYYVSFGADPRMLVFAALAALATTLLAGGIPALRASRTDVQDALRDGDKGTRGGGFARFAKGLVVAEIALTVVLLAGAGTFIRGLDDVLAFDYGTGADPDRIATGQVALLSEQYPQGADRVRFFERMVERLRADPDVESASVASALPGARAGGFLAVATEGEAQPERGYRRAQVGHVDDHFAQTYDIRLLAGRWFDGRDTADSERVAVIDARLAQALWPGREPLGQRLQTEPGSSDAQTLTVVGVTAALHLVNADDSRDPTLLLPLRQHPQRSVVLTARTRDAAKGFVPRLAEIVHGEDANTPVYRARTQRQAIEMGRVGPMVLTQIFTGVGLLALALAAAGLYGVLAFAVAQRTREIGIRRAIGAGRLAIADNVGRRVFWQVALGLGIGIGLGLPWASLLASARPYATGHDAAMFVAVVAVIVLASLLAVLAPLRRALRVDPMTALRHD